ncbi:ABC transporter ATP-binding protein [Pseudorhodoferax sp. Leaf267]|uniref:ABC transporter ATP-binding protein n=1 Tax=Pseudorhodoferax sp. Leaf267 TaxID=1736316 RepID=UPI0006F3034E|nr:ABC transporter ATP-binding protein [Pseudorhodoferax sp. Leaf267]KQP22144.1 ABC transporter ATP-binding protein [Pseudorhodoferax sp. Leaf267]
MSTARLSVDTSAAPPRESSPSPQLGTAAAGQGAEPLLQLRGIGHQFGGLSVLSHVDVSVPQGCIVGLLGPNGSGKTTCFNIASGFLSPRSGAVLYQGVDVTAWSVQRRGAAGLVRTFQTPKVFEHMSVRENLMVGEYKSTRSGWVGALLRLPAARSELKGMRERADACAHRFGLAHLLDVPAGRLPAGQRRIVELARACIGQPRMLLLDEPSSGLNSEEIETLRHWIQTLNADGLSILLVSHDMGLMTVCTQANVLYFGEIIATGSLAQVQDDPRVREAYLGV